ncbi:MAG TPA: hypothetical protein EYP35_07775 [Desulfobacterales bacterium]|nr:hypothetical protein [Desulfobacterales bacterium]
MKKVICVAAAFLMVAGVATVASAEVSLSGSARARIRYNDDGVKDGVDKWDSRLRIKINATTEGGGYAKGRIRLLDGTWGLGNDYTPTAKGDGNVWSDYAFVGFKKGNIDVAAGKMPTAFSAWFSDDERRDRFRVKYTDGGLLLAFTYDKRIYEFKDTSETIDVPVATLEDGSVLSVPVSVDGTPLGGDKDVWGISYTQKFSDTFKGGARLVYVVDDATANNDGFKGTVNFGMSFAGNNIFIEQSYKDGDIFSDTADDQYGGYAEWNATYGSVTPVVRVGYTVDGFQADETFGWLMVGGDVPTTNIKQVGLGGDTVFLGLTSKIQTTEALSFQANLVFFDIDDDGTAKYGDNPIEVSGQAKYKLGKGVALLARAGWLSSDSDVADDAFSAYGQMEVKF